MNTNKLPENHPAFEVINSLWDLLVTTNDGTLDEQMKAINNKIAELKRPDYTPAVMIKTVKYKYGRTLKRGQKVYVRTDNNSTTACIGLGDCMHFGVDNKDYKLL